MLSPLPTFGPRVLRSTVTALMLAAIVSPCIAQDDLSLDGYVATTAGTTYKALHPDIFYHAKLEVQYKVSKSTEAQIQVKGQSNEGERLRFREATIRIKLNKDDKIKVGNLKKPVGEEETYNEEDLPTIDRTYLYNYLSPMNHVGRDIGVQFIHEPDEEEIAYSLGAYLNNSSTFAATGRVAFPALVSSATLAASAVFQNLRLDEGVSLATILGNLSLAHTDDNLYWNVEGFAGVDPFASRFRQLATGNATDRVWLAGGKIMASYLFSSKASEGERDGFEPVVVLGYLLPDTHTASVYTVELLAGLNYNFNNHTRVRVNVHPLLSKNGISDDYSQVGSSVYFEFQVRW